MSNKIKKCEVLSAHSDLLCFHFNVSNKNYFLFRNLAGAIQTIQIPQKRTWFSHSIDVEQIQR